MRYTSFLFLITCLINTPYCGYAEGKISFTDITAAAGLQFHHVDGRSGERYFLETVGSGAAFFDYDGDGWIDIYFVNGADLPGFRSPQSPTNVLYRNNGNSTFTDVTEQAGVGDTGYGGGCAVGDYDNDGNLDVYVTNFGANVLYRNNGNSTFTDVTQHAGVGDRRWSLGCAFADYDNDGFVDLYVTNYIDFHFETHTNCTQKGVAAYCPPESFEGAPDTLYRNNGDGTFTDVTTIAGVYNEGGKGMGVVFGDYDNDGDADCYVGNDAGENFLYQNRGNGTFTNVGWMAGVEADENGNVQGTMGVDFGDYDNDGLLDLIAINYQQQPNALYRNDNANFFTDVSFVAGMADSVPYVGWGVDFFDVDNDGDKDLLIANGHLQDAIEQYDDTTTYPQHNHLLINNGQGYFVNESVKTGNGLQSRKVSRGLATGDYDNDGDLDVLICNANDTPQLLRNDSEMQENWILIHTIGTRSNRAGIGTRVKIQTDTLIQIDEVRGGSGYLSQNDLRLHFGIGAHKHIDRIEARWPSGIVDIIRDVAPNQIITITEGTHVR
ncbi:CRTAC1 family protein [Candidatus Poribacteria bacterium]|nr:CRTAC1 family protein [Candidatus Poribacteria bacterium]MYA55124.1 CRTAC1 family protein [Candidatus Poribacteria bacterium]